LNKEIDAGKTFECEVYEEELNIEHSIPNPEE
jgi:hypothetical protein